MAGEVLQYLKPEGNQVILDMTFGAGGHSRRILAEAPNARILALDRDPTAMDYANKLAEEYPDRVTFLLGRFSELPALLANQGLGLNSIDGMLFDFGCSSMQFDTPNRGFAVSHNGPLDMRMDQGRFPAKPTAADVLERANEEDLYQIIKIYGEEKKARKIARAIIDARYLFKNLTTTQDLADLVDSVYNDELHFDKLHRPAHSATKTFQALRIFVNNELNEINFAMIIAQKYLKLGGRIVTISFHSLEDLIVKRHLLGNLIANTANPLPLKYSSHNYQVDEAIVNDVLEKNWHSLTKHVVVPKYDEVEANPRSRSAKLRAAVRIR